MSFFKHRTYFISTQNFPRCRTICIKFSCSELPKRSESPWRQCWELITHQCCFIVVNKSNSVNLYLHTPDVSRMLKMSMCLYGFWLLNILRHMSCKLKALSKHFLSNDITAHIQSKLHSIHKICGSLSITTDNNTNSHLGLKNQTRNVCNSVHYSNLPRMYLGWRF